MRKKDLIRGTLILGLAGITSKFLGFFFRIPLINLIGEEGIGLYQLTYPLYTFLLAIAAGIPIAVSKMISERLAVGKKLEARNIFKVSLITLGIFGGISSSLLIAFSHEIIVALKWSKDSYYSLIGISLAPLFTCLLSSYRGYFQGLQYMGPPASSQLFEQITRVLVGVGLAYVFFPKGIAVAAGAASFGAVSGAIVALLWMMYFYSRNKIDTYSGESSSSMKRLLGEMLKIAIPISLAQTIGSVMGLLDSIMVPSLLRESGYAEQTATVLYGQLSGKAMVLINVPLTLSIALAQSIVPAISEAHAKKVKGNLEKNVRIAYKTAMILALPCAAGLYTLSYPILSLIFKGMADGWELMQILAVGSIFIIIAQSSTSILNGIGRTYAPLIAMIVGGAIKIIISIIFIPIPEYNIKAAAYGTLFSYIAVAFIDLILVVKYTKVYIGIVNTFVTPVICTVVMMFSVIFVYNRAFSVLSSGNMATLASIITGAVVYFIMLLVTRTMSIKEIVSIFKRG
jgi:stage V sporulation protein B